jgi:aromatic ring-opening dioxygenase LigB subunit
LAHTHLPCGPYGWSPDAQPFDEAVAHWLQSGASAGTMGPLKKLAPAALSCAYAGLAILAGVGSVAPLAMQSLFGPVAPGYYGMLVAQLLPQ